MRAGDTVVIAPGVPHKLWNTGEDAARAAVLLRAAVLARRHGPARGLMRAAGRARRPRPAGRAADPSAAPSPPGGRVIGDNLTRLLVGARAEPRHRPRHGRRLEARAIAARRRAGDFGINFVAIDEGPLGRAAPRRVAAAAAEQAIRDTQMIAVVGALRSRQRADLAAAAQRRRLAARQPRAPATPASRRPSRPASPSACTRRAAPTFARMIERRHRAGPRRCSSRRPAAAWRSRPRPARSPRAQARPPREAAGDAPRRRTSARRRGDLRRQRPAGGAGRRRGAGARGARRDAVFRDELTRAGLPGRLHRAARRRAVFVSAAPRARLDGRADQLRARPSSSSSSARPTRTRCSAWRATKGVLDAIEAAGRRANVRRAVAERYLARHPVRAVHGLPVRAASVLARPANGHRRRAVRHLGVVAPRRARGVAERAARRRPAEAAVSAMSRRARRPA